MFALSSIFTVDTFDTFINIFRDVKLIRDQSYGYQYQRSNP